MYPDDWGTPLSWADRWISEHESIARGLGKPTVLEEYGVRVSRDAAGRISGGLDRRLSAYTRWNTLVSQGGGNAAMFWMLAGAESSGGLYKDYDGYSVYRGDETSHLLSDFARRFSASAPACAEAGAHSRNPSPFVRVRRPVLRAALSWLAGDG
jgi:mannan endo-1,4-beta-mannosidase